MKYMGSKSRIAKYIVPIIQQNIKDYNLTTYAEPFVGGANIIDKISCERRIGCDKQKYLIALYQNLDKIQTLPDFITKEHYSSVREDYNDGLGIFADWYIGAIGFLASYNGRFFDGGYAGLVNTKSGTVRNYYDEAKRNLEEQIPRLKNIEFRCGDYRKTCGDLENALIYCDPPYINTKHYEVGKNFNNEEFLNWCRKMSEKNIILISGQSASDDFKCVWEKKLKRTIDNSKRILTTERLYMLNNIH